MCAVRRQGDGAVYATHRSRRDGGKGREGGKGDVLERALQGTGVHCLDYGYLAPTNATLALA
jgi:hypothetical protein